MNARDFTRLSDRWEWVVAGSLSVASCAALVLLLVALARAQGREALRAECQVGDALASLAGEHVFSEGSGRPEWLATGTRAPACPFCTGTRLPGDPTDSGIWTQSRYATTASSAPARGGDVPASRVRTTLIALSVVIVWLLGLRLLVGTPLAKPCRAHP
jgi:hypothetical protein